MVYAIEAPSYKKIEQVYNSSGVKLEKLHLATTVSIRLRSKIATLTYCIFPPIEAIPAESRLPHPKDTNIYAGQDNAKGLL